ncbi:MAG: hypothetical protein ACOCZL_03190, partial [Bacteroidota bacterium]
MKRKKTFFLESFELKVFTITYILSCVLIYWVVSFLLFEPDLTILIIVSLGFLMLAALGWAFLYVLFSIPQRLAENFDSIKNDISSGKITKRDTFADAICSFLVRFYNYSFFDVNYSAMRIKGDDIHFSAESIAEVLDWDQVTDSAGKSERIIVHNPILVDNKKQYTYTVPIHFGDKFLGFFSVFTSHKLGKLRLKLLYLENFYIDDQL